MQEKKDTPAKPKRARTRRPAEKHGFPLMTYEEACQKYPDHKLTFAEARRNPKDHFTPLDGYLVAAWSLSPKYPDYGHTKAAIQLPFKEFFITISNFDAAARHIDA